MTRPRLLVLAWALVTPTLCLSDHFFHLRTGRLHYNWHPFVDGQSVWAWLIFAVAAALFITSAAVVPLRDVPDRTPWPGIVDALALFIGAYALSGEFGATHPTLLFWALVVAWLVRIAVRRTDRLWYAAHGVALATVGVVAEGLFSSFGLFDYQLQQVVNCPWWLAGLYLHGSIALLEVARGVRLVAQPAPAQAISEDSLARVTAS